METGGLIMMVVSLSFVLSLAGFCTIKVLFPSKPTDS